MKKILNLLFTFIYCSVVFSQVGINTKNPNSKTLLHISESDNQNDEIQNKGIIIPRLSEAQRDAIKPELEDNSLMIFNTDENCYNFWNSKDEEWKSLCGSLGKSTFTIECTSIEAKGDYYSGENLIQLILLN